MVFTLYHEDAGEDTGEPGPAFMFFFLIRILALSAQALRGLYSTEFLRSLFHIVELYAVSSQKYVNLLFFYFQISNYIDKSSMYKVLSVGQAVKNT